jgi:hypothetical protein
MFTLSLACSKPSIKHREQYLDAVIGMQSDAAPSTAEQASPDSGLEAQALSAHANKHSAPPMYPMTSMAGPLPVAVIFDQEPQHEENGRSTGGRPSNVAQNMAELLRRASKALTNDTPGLASNCSLLQGAIAQGQSPAEALLHAQQSQGLSSQASHAVSAVLKSLASSRSTAGPSPLHSIGSPVMSSPLQGKHLALVNRTGSSQGLKSRWSEGFARALGLSRGSKAGAKDARRADSTAQGYSIQAVGTSPSKRRRATRGIWAMHSSDNGGVSGPHSSSSNASRSWLLRLKSTPGQGPSKGVVRVGSGAKKALFIQPSEIENAGVGAAAGSIAHRNIQQQLQFTASPLQSRSRVVGAGLPSRGAQRTVQQGQPGEEARFARLNIQSSFQGEGHRRGANFAIQFRSNSVEAADLANLRAKSGSTTWKPDTMQSEVSSRNGGKRAPLVMQASGSDYAGTQAPQSQASAASTLGFWAFASRLWDPPPPDMQPAPSTASSLGFWALGSQLFGHHKSVEVQPQASSAAHQKRARIQMQRQGSQGVNTGAAALNIRPATPSVHGGRGAKRPVLIVQSGDPSAVEQSYLLSRASVSRRSSSSSSRASRRGDILQVGRSGSVIAADSTSMQLSGSGSTGSSSRSRRRELLQLRHTDSVRQADSATLSTGSATSSGGSRRLEMLQVPSGNQASSSELAQGSPLASRLSTRSGRARRTRQLEAKPGMSRNRRNFGDLVRASSESTTLADSIRSNP